MPYRKCTQDVVTSFSRKLSSFDRRQSIMDEKTRQRSKAFSPREVDIIRGYMLEKHAEITAKFSNAALNSASKRKQDGLWADLTQQVNAVGVCPRSVGQVKEKWRNMVRDLVIK